MTKQSETHVGGGATHPVSQRHAAPETLVRVAR